MKLAITAMTALAATTLALAPGLATAKSVNSQLSQSQIDNYCAGAGVTSAGATTFTLQSGKTITGIVDCTSAGQSKVSASSAAADDVGGAESANDADSSHED